MERIIFNHDTHRRFYYRALKQSGMRKNPAARALFYILGISKETRNHIDELFDWKRRRIFPDGICADWQTSNSLCHTLAALHFWEGNTGDSRAYWLTEYVLQTSSFAPFYAQAMKLRYPGTF